MCSSIATCASSTIEPSVKRATDSGSETRRRSILASVTPPHFAEIARALRAGREHAGRADPMRASNVATAHG